MATYMQGIFRNSVQHFARFGQGKILCKPLTVHQPQTSLLTPQFVRNLSRPSQEASTTDNEVPNPFSYPEEYQDVDGLTTFHGDLQAGEERPHMLHAVWRIRSMRRRPWWERDVIEALGLQKNSKVMIHKNTPAVNELLTQVRHLVRIKPIILKYGLPNGDYENTLLKQNGEFIVKRKIKGLRVISEEDEKLLNEAQNDDQPRTDSK